MGFIAAIATAIGTFLGATGTLLGASILLSGVMTAVNFGLRAIIGRPKIPNFLDQARGRQITTRLPTAPWRIVYGNVGRLGGVIVFLTVTGTNNEFLHLIIVLSGHKLHAINAIRFDGDEVPLDGSGDATGKYAGFVHVEKHNGDPADTTQPFPGLAADAPDKWTSDHLWRGRGKIYVRLKYDANLFPNGVPNITADVEGAEVYDPRTDSTAFSDNAALCVRDFLTNPIYGLGSTSAEINDTLLGAAANVCDEDVDLAAGGTQKRYTVDGTFDTGQKVSDTLKALLASMAGYAVFSGGQWCVIAGAWRTASNDFDESDFRDAVQVQTRSPKRELCNAVKGTLVSADNDWQPQDFPPFIDAGYVTEDGGETLYDDVQFAFVTDLARAQRLAKIHLERSRRQIVIQAKMKICAWAIVPGDVVTVTRARYGWDHKTFEAVSVALVPDQANGMTALGVDVELRETDANVFAWDKEETAGATGGGLSLPDWATAQPPTNLHLVSGDATALAQSDGRIVTRIRATWDPPADQFVLSGGKINVQYKPSADSAWTSLPPLPGDAVECFISPVADGVAYDVQIWSENGYGISSAKVQALGHVASQGTGIAASGCVRPSSYSDVGTLSTLQAAVAYDTDLDTTATVRGGNTTGPKDGDCTWSGIPAVTGMTAAKLVVKSDFSENAATDPPTGTLRYSLDGGSSWTNIFSQAVDRALTSDEITLSTSQDLTLIRVQGQVSSSSVSPDGASLDIYDIRVEYSK